MTKIAYVGNFGRSWNTEEHLARDAEAIGCEVVRLDEREFARALAGGGPEYVLPRDADLVLYTKTYGLPPLAGKVWRLLEAEGIRTASYHLDLYRGLARGSEVLSDPFWQTGAVFTADGDPETEAELALLGIVHRWLPAACVSAECVEVADPVALGPAAPAVVFVGSHRGYHPEWPWRLNMLDALRHRYGPNFAALGDPPIRGFDLNRLYQQPGRVVVGDSLALPGHARYWSDRYYETIGRGGFLIGPRVPGIEEHFQDGGHFVAYDPGDLDGLFGLIDTYLDATEAARYIARAGQAHVRAHHTYRHRVVEMLAGVGLPLEGLEVPA